MTPKILKDACRYTVVASMLGELDCVKASQLQKPNFNDWFNSKYFGTETEIHQ